MFSDIERDNRSNVVCLLQNKTKSKIIFEWEADDGVHIIDADSPSYEHTIWSTSIEISTRWLGGIVE